MKIGVIILNYKARDLVMECMRSIKETTVKSIILIIVDNNSQDGLEGVVAKYSDVRFIQTGLNLGYAGGNNVGIKKALELGCDCVLILNPDTVVDKYCLERLTEAIKETGIGIVGPKVLFKTKKYTKKLIWFAGGIFDKANVLGKHKGVDEEDLGQYEKIEETDYVSGGAMFVRKEVFEKIGFFDERFFLYYEDLDFCIRARKAGFRVIYLPQAVVFHKNAQSTGLGSPLQDYFITRNRFLIASKFLSLRTKFALIREGIKNINNPTRRLAFLDFFLGRFGKGSFLK